MAVSLDLSYLLAWPAAAAGPGGSFIKPYSALGKQHSTEKNQINSSRKKNTKVTVTKPHYTTRRRFGTGDYSRVTVWSSKWFIVYQLLAYINTTRCLTGYHSSSTRRLITYIIQSWPWDHQLTRKVQSDDGSSHWEISWYHENPSSSNELRRSKWLGSHVV